MAWCDTIQNFDTIQTADCVEACPIYGHEATMIVATYQLNTNTCSDENMSIGGVHPSRSGTLQHYRILTNESDTHGATQVVKVQHVEVGSGVFDAKWSSSILHEDPVLALATSNGSVQFYALAETIEAGKRADSLKKLSWEVGMHKEKVMHPPYF